MCDTLDYDTEEKLTSLAKKHCDIGDELKRKGRDRLTPASGYEDLSEQ